MFLYPGSYKNFDDLEKHLTREELVIMISKARELKSEDYRFTAALQGIDLDEHASNSEFEEVKRRVEARITGRSEEELELDGLIHIEYEG